MYSVVCFFRSMASDSGVMEDAKRVSVVDGTNDSCIAHQSLDTATDTYCTADTAGHVVEVKMQDVNMEDVHESNVEYQDVSVKVRVCALCIFCVLKLAGCISHIYWDN